MSPEKCKELFFQIYNKYSQEMWIHEGDPGRGNGACAYLIRREIVLPEGTFSHPEEWDILVLLHEVGHIKTNKPKMKTYEKKKPSILRILVVKNVGDKVVGALHDNLRGDLTRNTQKRVRMRKCEMTD